MLANKKITAAASKIAEQVPFITGIESESDYQAALSLMDVIINNYDDNIVLIEALGNVIARYEDESEEYALFNKRQAELDPGVATLKVLMDQHHLSYSDFENEIGKKSLVSQVMAGKRNLTVNHIQRLSNRFGISPAIFF